MRVWKLIGIIAVSLAMISLIGCGKAEEESATETEVEAVATETVVVDYIASAEDIGTEITCGICGMKMAVTEDMPAVTVDGENYFFCTADEKAEFAAAPEKFIKAVDEAVGEVEEVVEEATGE